MSLESGHTLAHYEILEPIGKGGMGEVFRARDTKLNRDVAIKVLPEEFASDEARLARFRREAQVLASLNHPNVAAIYGLEESAGVAALVLELVEGEDLAERLKRGAIPYEEAMAVARELAAGLEAAHEKGIVHRDLKPGNIKLGTDGEVKILDFGLAKAYEGESASGGDNALSQSPTISRQMTQAGVILGTAAYMSPEQAKGKPVDKRADIWAFGVVLYEMLTGRRLFDGEDLTETLASVVKDEPDLKTVPRKVRRLLGKCLQRDPKRRLRDIGDAWSLLDDSESVSTPPSRLPWLLAAAMFILAIASFSLWISTSPGSEDSVAPIRFRVQRPESMQAGGGFGTFQLSPDGRHIAFTEGDGLWLRSLDSFDARALEGTRGATYPFWSPDSSSIGFFADEQLKRVSLDGTRIQTLCEAPGARGASWNNEGTILFSRAGGSGIFRVPAQGGTPDAVTTLSSSPRGGDRYPEFLPGGERFLYLSLAGDPDIAGIYVGSLRDEPPVRVLPGNGIASYSPAAATGEHGHLLFRHDGTLMAQPFDPIRVETVGAMFPVVGDVGEAGNTGYAAFSVSRSGTLAYSSGEEPDIELVWRDRSGERTGVVAAGPAIDFSLSPDGQAIATSVYAGNGTDIWLHDSAGGTPSRYTFGPSPGWAFPIWSPDGNQIAFASSDFAGQDHYEIRVKRLDMSEPERTVARLDTVVSLWDWSPDGTHLLYTAPRQKAFAIWSLPLEENDGTPTSVVAGPGSRFFAQYSPDGRWLAYDSDDHGAFQVYVQPSEATSAVWQISVEGGSQPRWRADSRELYFVAPTGTLMAVAIGTREGSGAASATLEHGTPTPLFDSVPTTGRFAYEPASDGQRFLVSAPAASSREPISIVLNWQASLEN